MENVTLILSRINAAVWGAPMLILLVGTHIFLSARTRFVQRRVLRAIKLSVTDDSGSGGDISQYGALMTSLAATIGTGNIIGVATSIVSGGPGAVFWCWITGILGMATKYGEALLAVKYRVRTSDGTMLGGPMYVLERGLNAKWLGVLFAVFTMLASFGIGASVQSNALTGAVRDQFGVAPAVTSAAAALLAAAAIFGGVKSIAKICGTLVPFMGALFFLGSFVVLALNAPFLGQSVSVIVKSAFAPRAVAGGLLGGGMMTAMRFGVSRGLFTNESGLGSAPIAAAAAKTKNPVRQALVSMTGTFWDTVIMCAITGLVIVSTMLKFPAIMVNPDAATLTRESFAQMRTVGAMVLTFSMVLFAFATIISWSYYGERCAEYLLGKRAIPFYKALYVLSAFAGGVATLDFVWTASDTLNFLMAIPNLIALLALSGTIRRMTVTP